MKRKTPTEVIETGVLVPQAEAAAAADREFIDLLTPNEVTLLRDHARLCRDRHDTLIPKAERLEKAADLLQKILAR